MNLYVSEHWTQKYFWRFFLSFFVKFLTVTKHSHTKTLGCTNWFKVKVWRLCGCECVSLQMINSTSSLGCPRVLLPRPSTFFYNLKLKTVTNFGTSGGEEDYVTSTSNSVSLRNERKKQQKQIFLLQDSNLNRKNYENWKVTYWIGLRFRSKDILL